MTYVCVSIQLANTLLPFFDPTAQGPVEQAKEPFKLIPMYRSPIIRQAVLPGRGWFSFA